MKYVTLLLLAFAIALFPATPATPDDPAAPQSDLPGKIDRAVERGIQFLKNRQMADGHWQIELAPMTVLNSYRFPLGQTALCVFALLKAGVPPDDPVIKKGLDYIRNFKSKRGACKPADAKFDTIYCASCVVLALEALHTVPLSKSKDEEVKPDEEEKPKDKWGTWLPPEAKKKKEDKPRWNSPQGRADKANISEYIKWICANREGDKRWRYPTGDPPGVGDLSNCQYAILALNVARRLNISHPKQIYQDLCNYLIEHQEKKGPEVSPPFPVPAADRSIKALKKFQKKFNKELTKIVEKCRKLEKQGKDPLEDPSNDPRTYVEEEQEKIFGKEEGKPMKARGWCYQEEDPDAQDAWKRVVSGSMTTSAIITLVASKDALEGSSYWNSRGKIVNQCIRDGCAWIAHHFSVSHNPPGNINQHYYYLYGLERAGVLAMVERFGERKWFEEGARFLVGAQRGDGGWHPSNGTCGPVADTCFALLFLKRATTPLVKLPEVIITGARLRKK